MSSTTEPALQCACHELTETRHNPTPARIKLEYGSIRRSAASGCALCCVLQNAVRPILRNRSVTDETRLKVNISNSGMQIGYDLKFTDRLGESDTVSYEHIEVFRAKHDDAVPPTRTTPRVVDNDILSVIPTCGIPSEHTGTDLAFGKATRWLSECLVKHKDICATMCNHAVQKLPDRVLDLQAQSPSGIALLETNGMEGRYVCLSHCWGGHQPLTTTKDFLSERKAGIVWHELPRTFQDAVTYTRKLTLRYLWIDSLCIIQDDASDWTTQSSLMAHIYRNAVITLSASASNGPNTGLFLRPNLKLIDGKTHTLSLQSITQRPDCSDIYVRYPIIHTQSEHPLMSRAWVHQERLLSPRILHFGPHELIWECMADVRCECGEMQPGLPMWQAPKLNFHPYTLATLPRHQLALSWRRLVADYSRMRLTKSKDIFPALSGAAQIYAESLRTRGLDSQYVAGMWRESLIEECLWSRKVFRGQRSTRPEIWRAPSWSWASVQTESGVAWRLMSVLGDVMDSIKENTDQDAGELIYYARVTKVQCTPVDARNPFGAIAAAQLDLCGPLFGARLEGSSSDDITIPSLRVMLRDEEFVPDYDFVAEQGQTDAGVLDVFCLKLMSVKHFRWKRQYLFCLVLRRLDSVGSRYERIGLLSCVLGRLNPSTETWFENSMVEDDACVNII